MSYENFVQRTTFSSDHGIITYETTPEKMACIEQIAFSLGLKKADESTHDHHIFIIDGENSEKIFRSIELAWAALDSYEINFSSLAIVSDKKSIVILESERNQMMMGTVKLIASMAGVKISEEGVMKVSSQMYDVLFDFIMNLKER